MIIKDILDAGSNVSISISAKDLKEVIDYAIGKTREELENKIVEDKMEEYLSTQQVVEMISVCKSTLCRWHKSGYLPHIEIGGKVRYRKSEIKARFLEGNSNNN